MSLHPTIAQITERIVQRSKTTRKAYLDQMEQAKRDGVARAAMSCGNLAHAYAGCNSHEKDILSKDEKKNLGIISAYNDMLSAHKVYEDYPKQMREYAIKHHAVAQVAGAVPSRLVLE